MDIKQMATELIMNQFKSQSSASEADVGGAVQGLLGGDFDIASLIEKFSSNGGLATQLQSWLGDGANQGVSAENIMSAFGQDSVSQFASKLGVDSGDAASGLSEVIPSLIDKCSSGGNLLESVGGVSGALNMAKGLFSK